MLLDLHTHSVSSDDSRATAEQYAKWAGVLHGGVLIVGRPGPQVHDVVRHVVVRHQGLQVQEHAVEEHAVRDEEARRMEDED